MIEVDRLTRRYGGTLALDGVSFKVAAGEVAGFLGPNGAGKSTCLKILTGSLAPDGGRARIGGEDVVTNSLAVRRLIGFMPETVPLYPESPVGELLRFVAELKGVPRRERDDHLAGIAARTGIADVQGKLVGHLSKGYRQRVGLAQALVGDPPVLILDEPTAGLDPHQIVEIRELIRALRGHKTVLLSSHILTEVSQVCDRVLILDKGRLVCEESAGSLARYGAGDRHAVSLTWDGDRDAVGAALARVVGVDEVRLTADGAEVLIGGNPIEVKPRLVESVLAAGGRLQRLEEHGPTLEDLFLRLTGGDRNGEDH
jgi:ABC-2 type transport system ATP-binding protein